MVSADPVQSTIINSNTAQTIPSEIIQYILHFITQPTDLLNCALTCKSWSFHAMELLWFKPQFNQLLQWKTFCEILSCEQQPSTSSSSSSLSTPPSLPSKTTTTTTTKTLTFPYAAFIRRINLSSLSEHVTNTQLAVLKTCYRLERITLIGCTSITDDGLLDLLSLKAGKYIMSIDLSDVTNITDKAIIAIANRCSRLQGLNLSMCKEDNKKCSGVTDIGIVALAKKCRQLRRIKLNNCDKLTDVSALALARYCPRLLEIDCPVTDNAMIEIFTRLKELREFRLQQHESISDIAFEPLSGFFSDLLPLPDSLDNDTHFTAESYNNQFGNNQNTTTTSEENDHNDSDATTKKNIAATSGHTDTNNASNNNSNNNNNNNNSNNNSNNSDTSNNNNIRQISKSSFHRTLNNAGYYEQLRVLDLTNASYITDEAIRCIVHAAPKVRNLLLNKCKEITDKGISYICQLERYLHYLHLGHCERLTDQAIIELSEKCTRIRYLDLGQCTLLTDESVKGLAKLPRLKRIGLVKCFNITDIAIDYLISEPRIANSLERVHLSYCIQLTKKSIQKLLNFCQRLNHLSLTSVPDFTRPEIQRYRRVPPKNFTTQQQNAFCVFSGNGVNELRKYLNDNHNGGNGNSSSNNLDQHQQQQLQQQHQQQQSLLNTRNQTLLQVLANRSTSQTSPSSSTSTSYRSSPTNNNRQLPSPTITSSTLMNDFNQININTLTPSLVLPSMQPVTQEVEVEDEDEDESMNGDEQLMD